MQRLLSSGKITSIRGGVTLDLYNQAAIPRMCCTVTTRINTSDLYWLLTMKQTTENAAGKSVIYQSANGNKYKIKIRKYTPRDCFRLMGVRDDDFDKLLATDENGKRLISNSKLYQLAGNSIVTNCMVAMFESLFYPKEGNKTDEHGQLSLF